MSSTSRNKNLNVRLSDTEYKDWTESAETLGFQDRSAFVRTAVASYLNSDATAQATLTELESAVTKAQAFLAAQTPKEES